MGSAEFRSWDSPYDLTHPVEDRHGRRGFLIGDNFRPCWIH